MGGFRRRVSPGHGNWRATGPDQAQTQPVTALPTSQPGRPSTARTSVLWVPRCFSSHPDNTFRNKVRAGLLKEGSARGCHFHSSHRRFVRGDALAGLGHLAARRDSMSALYWVSGLLTLGLFAYLLYALIKPERF